MKGCELCEPKDLLFESDFAYVRYESSSLNPGHVIVVPRRHVADFFDMSAAEQGSVLALLNRAHKLIEKQFASVPDPRGGIRCVLARKT